MEGLRLSIAEEDRGTVSLAYDSLTQGIMSDF